MPTKIESFVFGHGELVTLLARAAGVQPSQIETIVLDEVAESSYELTITVGNYYSVDETNSTILEGPQSPNRAASGQVPTSHPQPPESPALIPRFDSPEPDSLGRTVRNRSPAQAQRPALRSHLAPLRYPRPPLYNKGGYQAITPGMDLTTLGRK